MNLQSVVSDVRNRFDQLTSQGQEVVKTLPITLKHANDVLVSGVQTLVKTDTETAMDLYSAALAGFEKAKADGIKAVVSNPVDYLPPSDKLVMALSETVTIVSKTGDDLYKTLKASFLSNGHGDDTDDVDVLDIEHAATKPAKKPRKTAAKKATTKKTVQ